MDDLQNNQPTFLQWCEMVSHHVEIEIVYEDGPKRFVLRGCNDFHGIQLRVPNEFRSDSFSSLDANLCKPILHPLSRLFEEGDDAFSILSGLTYNMEGSCTAYDEWVDAFLDHPRSADTRIIQAPKEVFDRLASEHYNVWNLPEGSFRLKDSKEEKGGEG